MFRCKARRYEVGQHPISSCLDPASVLWFWGRAPKPAFYFEGTRYCVRADEIMLVKETKK